MISNDQYKNEMSSLGKVKAPRDFLQQVNARLERRAGWAHLLQTLFVPLRIKLPLELAAVMTTLIIGFYIYQGGPAPQEPAELKAPQPARRVLAPAGNRPRSADVKLEAKEIAPAAALMGAGSGGEKALSRSEVLSIESTSLSAEAPAADHSTAKPKK